MCRVFPFGERAAIMLSAGALSRADLFFRSRITNIRKSQDRARLARRSDRLVKPTQGSIFMNTTSKIVIAAVAGAALGAMAIQGLHAQAKLKAYSIGEIVPIAGAAISPSYLAAARKALANASGRSMGTLKGRIFHAEGEPLALA